jgi:CelD/BcsL family acetyltransferase involved in cellulose biosynthesis
MIIRQFHTLAALPDGFRGLLAARGESDFFSGPHWYANFLATCLDPGDRPVFLTVASTDGLPLAVVPLCHLGRRRHATTTGREASSLTNFYTCLYRPAMAQIDPVAAAAAVAAGLAAIRENFDLLDLNSLAAESALVQALPAALQARGLWCQRYFHFGNWYEAAPDSAEAYLAARPAALRSTLARKARRLARDDRVAYRIYREPADLPAALAAYAQVYAASWKHAEPYPDFTAGLAAAAAAAGALRLGVCRIEGAPAAAQIWITAGGRATIFKLAYDERFKAHSPGSLLTAHMAQAAIEADGVREIDFGRGDDPYKRDWLSRRRERCGLLVFNPRTAAGLLQAARHLGGAWLKRRLPQRAAAVAAAKLSVSLRRLIRHQCRLVDPGTSCASPPSSCPSTPPATLSAASRP